MKKTNLALLIAAGLLAIINLMNGQTVTQDSCFYRNGRVATLMTYKDSKPVLREAFYATGELQMQAEYDPQSGLQHGIEKWFYRSGQLEESSEFVYGHAHGPSRTYLPDGSLESEVLYVEDRVVPKARYDEYFARR
ncbi:hypothetical protein KQI65_01845 [bacterium]|nr:hypothetical protein [bacterium]